VVFRRRRWIHNIQIQTQVARPLWVSFCTETMIETLDEIPRQVASVPAGFFHGPRPTHFPALLAIISQPNPRSTNFADASSRRVGALRTYQVVHAKSGLLPTTVQAVKILP
jgi:hypothetical protein